jgi:hypothetical protein
MATMSHSLCVIGVYNEVKMTVPMIVHYVHSYSRKNVTLLTYRGDLVLLYLVSKDHS